MDADVVVVGAGISGLACAHELQRAGVKVRVVEAESRVGGKMGSVHSPEGYLVELGPHEVRSGDPEMFRQFEALGIEGRRVVASPAVSRRYVVKDARPVPLPASPPGLLNTDLLTVGGKLRLLAEPFIRRGTLPDESVEAFFRRRLGPEIAAGPVDAFVAGVFAGDPSELSMRSAFPGLLEGERTRGSLLRWALHRARTGRRERERIGARRAELFSFSGGMVEWPKALAAALGPERVHTSTLVREIRPTAAGWRLRCDPPSRREIRARHLVLAVPAGVAGELLADLEPEAGDALRGLPYAPVAVVHLGFSREQIDHPLDGFGVLAPSGERRDVLGILWVSSLFEDRAPAGHVLTASFIGGARRPELPAEGDVSLIGRVLREHDELLGSRGSPTFAHVHRWVRAIPQYDMSHPGRVRTVRALEKRRSGLHFAGNYLAGVGIPAAWKDGRRVATDILAKSGSAASASLEVA